MLRVLLSAALLFVAACSSGSGDSDVATVDFEAAIADTANVTSYRLTQSTGQTADVAALGLSESTDPDPSQPSVVGLVTPERSYLEIDFGTLFSLPGSLDATLRMWVDPSRLVIDTTELATIFAGTDAGPMTPGVGFVDLARVETDAAELVGAIAGSGLPGLGELATTLPAALVEVTESEPGVFSGRISHADFITAMGGDVETLSRSLAAGIALNLDIDVDALTNVYVETYSSGLADMTVVVQDGIVREISETFDVTTVFDAMIADETLVPTATERAQIEDTFGDAVWTVETVITFEPQPDLVVDPAPATDDDRTDAWVEFLRNAGF